MSPLSQRQHEADIAVLTTNLIQVASRAVFYRTVAVISVVLLGVGLFFAANQYGRAESASKSAREAAASVHLAQVQACEASLQPGGVRFIIAAQIQQQLAQQKHVNYHKLFPNFDRRRLHDLISRSRVQQRQEIHDLLTVNCQRQFSAPGS